MILSTLKKIGDFVGLELLKKADANHTHPGLNQLQEFLEAGNSGATTGDVAAAVEAHNTSSQAHTAIVQAITQGYTSAIAAAIQALPTDKFVQGFSSYDAQTNTLNLLRSDGVIIGIDMTALLAEALPQNTDSIPQGNVNKYFTETAVRGTMVAAKSVSAPASVVATTSVADAIWSLQTQLSAVKHLSSQGAYNTSTNVMTLNMSDSSTVQIDMTAVITASVKAAIGAAPGALPATIASTTSVADAIWQLDGRVTVLQQSSGGGSTVADLTSWGDADIKFSPGISVDAVSAYNLFASNATYGPWTQSVDAMRVASATLPSAIGNAFTRPGGSAPAYRNSFPATETHSLTRDTSAWRLMSVGSGTGVYTLSYAMNGSASPAVKFDAPTAGQRNARLMSFRDNLAATHPIAAAVTIYSHSDAAAGVPAGTSTPGSYKISGSGVSLVVSAAASGNSFEVVADAFYDAIRGVFRLVVTTPVGTIQQESLDCYLLGRPTDGYGPGVFLADGLSYSYYNVLHTAGLTNFTEMFDIGISLVNNTFVGYVKFARTTTWIPLLSVNLNQNVWDAELDALTYNKERTIHASYFVQTEGTEKYFLGNMRVGALNAGEFVDMTPVLNASNGKVATLSGKMLATVTKEVLSGDRYSQLILLGSDGSYEVKTNIVMSDPSETHAFWGVQCIKGTDWSYAASIGELPAIGDDYLFSVFSSNAVRPAPFVSATVALTEAAISSATLTAALDSTNYDSYTVSTLGYTTELGAAVGDSSGYMGIYQIHMAFSPTQNRYYCAISISAEGWGPSGVFGETPNAFYGGTPRILRTVLFWKDNIQDSFSLEIAGYIFPGTNIGQPKFAVFSDSRLYMIVTRSDGTSGVYTVPTGDETTPIFVGNINVPGTRVMDSNGDLASVTPFIVDWNEDGSTVTRRMVATVNTRANGGLSFVKVLSPADMNARGLI